MGSLRLMEGHVRVSSVALCLAVEIANARTED